MSWESGSSPPPATPRTSASTTAPTHPTAAAAEARRPARAVMPAPPLERLVFVVESEGEEEKSVSFAFLRW